MKIALFTDIYRSGEIFRKLGTLREVAFPFGGRDFRTHRGFGANWKVNKFSSQIFVSQKKDLSFFHSSALNKRTGLIYLFTSLQDVQATKEKETSRQRCSHTTFFGSVAERR